MRAPFFYRETQGIRITVHPLFLGDQSDPGSQRFVFAYFVRIENVGVETAQLLRRHWKIHDSIGEDAEVEGEGVVGKQPLLEPGGVHEYQSFCVLKSPNGHMEGEYHFTRANATTFSASIPRFLLDATTEAGFN
ncbi:MAG: Co2+/Mg2+ efflux protein ApaG [Gemmatimonadota bacterium]